MVVKIIEFFGLDVRLKIKGIFGVNLSVKLLKEFVELFGIFLMEILNNFVSFFDNFIFKFILEIFLIFSLVFDLKNLVVFVVIMNGIYIFKNFFIL